MISILLSLSVARIALTLNSTLGFSGTPFECEATTVIGENNFEYIEVTLKLMCGSYYFATWTANG